ncbi:hypothetical protein L7F22_044450 [Adiantum nelumboides]|nr:hypothetical protein [Adiantum nelumboides]
MEEDTFLAFVESARQMLVQSGHGSCPKHTVPDEDTSGPSWGWVFCRILDCLKAYSSGVTPAILLSDLLKRSGGLQAEHLIYGRETLAPLIAHLFNRALVEGFPDSWTEHTIVPIHKSGDVMDPGTYRTIMIGPTLAKLYGAVLEEALSTLAETEGLRAPGQAGFRRSFSTIDHIFTLRCLIDQTRVKKRRLYCCFVDFRKAFDTVPRERLFRRLMDLGVGEEMIWGIYALYEHVSCRVRCPGGISDTLVSTIGVKQGCPLSPTLFGLYIDEIVDFIQQRGGDVQLSQAWLEKSRVENGWNRKEIGGYSSPGMSIYKRQKQLRARLSNIVTIDSIYEKSFITLDAILEVVILNIQLLSGTSSYILTLGDAWSTNTMDMYLHRKFYDLVDEQKGILKKGREIRLTGCRLRTAVVAGSSQTRLLPTEYLVVLLDEEQDEDAMLLGARFYSDAFSDIQIDSLEAGAEYCFYASSVIRSSRYFSHGDGLVVGFGGGETDHQSLRYLLTQAKLSEKHLSWANFLSMFHFQLVHFAGKKNVVADALSRRRHAAALSIAYQHELDEILEKIGEVEYHPQWNHVKQKTLLLTDQNHVSMRLILWDEQVPLAGLFSQGSMIALERPFISHTGSNNYQQDFSLFLEYGSASRIYTVPIVHDEEQVTLATESPKKLKTSFRSHERSPVVFSQLMLPRDSQGSIDYCNFPVRKLQHLSKDIPTHRVDCFWNERETMAQLVNITQLPALLTSPCLYQLIPLRNLSRGCIKVQVCRVVVKEIKLDYVCQGSRLVQCLESNEVSSFLMVLEVSDRHGVDGVCMALCFGRPAIEILQASAKDFLSWPEDEQALYLYSLQKEEYIVTIYDGSGDRMQNLFSQAGDIPWRIGQALKSESSNN